jgi:hypothetical protein
MTEGVCGYYSRCMLLICGDFSGLGAPLGARFPIGDGDGENSFPASGSGDGDGGILRQRGAER